MHSLFSFPSLSPVHKHTQEDVEMHLLAHLQPKNMVGYDIEKQQVAPSPFGVPTYDLEYAAVHKIPLPLFTRFATELVADTGKRIFDPWSSNESQSYFSHWERSRLDNFKTFMHHPKYGTQYSELVGATLRYIDALEIEEVDWNLVERTPPHMRTKDCFLEEVVFESYFLEIGHQAAYDHFYGQKLPVGKIAPIIERESAQRVLIAYP
jgi:hypothetical protein